MKRAAVILFVCPLLQAQQFSQRGYVETKGLFFPLAMPGDSSHAIGETILRWEGSLALGPSWKLNGSFDARADTHRQDEREFRIDWQDRTLQRPALSLRRLSATYHRGKFTAEFGKQFIRWGKADIFNPTDRFAPRDLLEGINYDFLGVLAARATYESGRNTIDLVFTPRITPSRAPLPYQRWSAIQAGYRVQDSGAAYPGAGQVGVRWNHMAKGFEFSGSFFEGFANLPSVDVRFRNLSDAAFTRFFPKQRMFGVDAATPLRWFTLKGESAHFTSTDRRSDEYFLFVIQAERQQGEWSFVGGYAGEIVTAERSALFLSADRALTKAFLGRAGYTISVSKSVALETAIRQDGKGAYLKGEYSQSFGQHWRVTGGVVLLHADADSPLSRYYRNSHGLLSIRYSF